MRINKETAIQLVKESLEASAHATFLQLIEEVTNDTTMNGREKNEVIAAGAMYLLVQSGDIQNGKLYWLIPAAFGLECAKLDGIVGNVVINRAREKVQESSPFFAALRKAFGD